MTHQRDHASGLEQPATDSHDAPRRGWRVEVKSAVAGLPYAEQVQHLRPSDAVPPFGLSRGATPEAVQCPTDGEAVQFAPRRSADGSETEPELPPRQIASGGGVTIRHYYRSNDHAPAHAHVVGGGRETRIGQNGHPLAGDPPLTADQQTVVDANRAAIRRALDKIGRWLRFNERNP